MYPFYTWWATCCYLFALLLLARCHQYTLLTAQNIISSVPRHATTNRTHSHTKTLISPIDLTPCHAKHKLYTILPLYSSILQTLHIKPFKLSEFLSMHTCICCLCLYKDTHTQVPNQEKQKSNSYLNSKKSCIDVPAYVQNFSQFII